eukprot:428006-Pyramimonas_sp.AAC.1
MWLGGLLGRGGALRVLHSLHGRGGRRQVLLARLGAGGLGGALGRGAGLAAERLLPLAAKLRGHVVGGQGGQEQVLVLLRQTAMKWPRSPRAEDASPQMLLNGLGGATESGAATAFCAGSSGEASPRMAAQMPKSPLELARAGASAARPGSPSPRANWPRELAPHVPGGWRSTSTRLKTSWISPVSWPGAWRQSRRIFA